MQRAKRLSLRPDSTYVALDSMNLLTKLTDWFARRSVPAHIRLGRLGERAARKYLQQKGLKFLLANYRTPRGEIDLIFRARGNGGAGRIFIRNKSNCLHKDLVKFVQFIPLPAPPPSPTFNHTRSLCADGFYLDPRA